MIPYRYYHPLYLSIVIILTLYCMFKYSRFESDRVLYCNKKGPQISALLVTIFFTIFFGLRPLASIFVDMFNYNETYLLIQNNEPYFDFDKDADNLLFDNLMSYFSITGFEISIFFLFIATIYFGCMYWSIKTIFPNDVLYALIIYIGAFSSFSYGTNGIKSGAAASIFLLAFAYYKKPLLIALFSFISLGFHHSMTLCIVALILAYIIQDNKYFYFFWIGCLLLSFVHINGFTEFFSQFTDERGQKYLLSQELAQDTFVGFRWDFILYGLPPILIGLWANYKHGINDRLYHLLLSTYLITNGIWMLCMYIPFNNRIAYLSWFILPIVSIYPFLKLRLKTRQYIQLNYVAALYLAFTVFATFFL